MGITPMMQQYLSMKEANPEAILFFRLGDFYEMFFDDAQLVSRELELTLTGKDCGLSERAPMCGVPYHAVELYIRRLIEKGYRVAICDQMTDPAESKGLVERAVTRVVTPGTIIETGILEERKANYILALCLQKERAGLAFCDVSTGEFSAYEIGAVKQRLNAELLRIAPSELLVNDDDQLSAIALAVPQIVRSKAPADAFAYKNALSVLETHFAVKGAEALGFPKQRLAICASGALLAYLIETQKNALSHILQLQPFVPEQYMTIDPVAAANLELFESGRNRARRGSLLAVIDKTVTGMGARMLRTYLERPLRDASAIERRLDAVEALMGDPLRMEAIRADLKKVYDVERLLSKIAYETVNARDALSLAGSLSVVPSLRERLSGFSSDGALSDLLELLDPLPSLTEHLLGALSEDAPLSVKEGGLFRPGYNEALDKLRSAAVDGKGWIAGLEQRERDETGIKNLKIGFNRVFGYYIEVTKSYYELVPYRYTRKQTLANCERFVTEELKEIEKTVLGADDQAISLEYTLFLDIRSRLKASLAALQKTAEGLKTLDALCSLAQVALENDYVRPQILPDGQIEIVDGRHPVVEASIGRERFVPNDTALDAQNRIMIITGPNMAGKSTYMRQVALIALLAHVGSFVPAKKARIPLIDRIFTRIGASDDLFGGQSTFMVEMSELATILKCATDHSLILLDEVGRGTSTYDGLSIAWAAVEHLAEKTLAWTLFATHYHELSELEGRLPGVVNYRITAKEQGNDVIFLRKIVRGGEDRSFGVAVASLAGLPASLIARARQIMARLEVNDEIAGSVGQSILDQRKSGATKQLAITDYPAMGLCEEIAAIDVMSLTPIEAMNTLYTLQEKARRV